MSTTVRVSFQGELGSNSDAASRELFPFVEPVSCATFEDALDAVATGEAAYAVIPIENSIAGRVADIHHLMPEYELHIVREFFLPIRFQLMGINGSTTETVRQVRSHPHALQQCRAWLRERSYAALVAEDTAGAAREVAALNDPSVAALAPKIAAEMHGLVILATNVADHGHNTTRFVVLGRDSAIPEQGSGPTITTFVFRVRNVPAALYKAMGGFATNGVNMTKLESYQLDGSFSATQFYADVEGHPDEPSLARALDELDYFCEEFRLLGTYPASPFRKIAPATPNGRSRS